MTSNSFVSKTVTNEKKFRNKYLLKQLTSPFCLFPFLAGVTDLMVLWALGIGSGIAIFAGVAGILGAVGYFFTRLATGDRTIVKKVLASMQKDALIEREKALDDLDRRLTADGDSRTESCLRDLRGLAKAFEDGKSWTGVLNDQTTVDILSDVDQLFKQCVFSLEKTLKLRYTASQLATKEARRPILKKRELLIGDIKKSIEQLGKVLANIHSLGLDEGSRDSELANIRRELDQSLEVAKKVKTRMSTLEKEMDLPNNE